MAKKWRNAAIEVNGVTRRYEDKKAVDDLSFEIARSSETPTTNVERSW
jgi:hypothetical protein